MATIVDRRIALIHAGGPFLVEAEADTPEEARALAIARLPPEHLSNLRTSLVEDLTATMERMSFADRLLTVTTALIPMLAAFAREAGFTSTVGSGPQIRVKGAWSDTGAFVSSESEDVALGMLLSYALGLDDLHREQEAADG